MVSEISITVVAITKGRSAIRIMLCTRIMHPLNVTAKLQGMPVEIECQYWQGDDRDSRSRFSELDVLHKIIRNRSI
jgi:hypothetical protein